MLLDFNSLINEYKIDVSGVLHVGAHYGQEIEIYENLGIKDIVMFEPSHKNFSILCSNVGDRAMCENIALGSSSGTMKMYVENKNSGMSNSLLRPNLHLKQYPDIKFEEEEEVQVQTLDSWIIKSHKQNYYNCIVMDVQGYELEVLLGSVQSLSSIDCIFCEVNRADLYENCAHVTEIDVFLRTFGFRRVRTNWIGNTWGDAFYVKERFIIDSGKNIDTINIIDTSFSHTKKVLGHDSACLIPTARFDWNRNIEDNCDLLVFTNNSVLHSNNFNSQKKIAWIIEPREIDNSPYVYLLKNYNKFSLVVSHDLEFLKNIPNGRYCPASCSWINPKDWKVSEKTKNVSIIASNKNFTEGHALRHESAKLLDVKDRFGSGYKSIENKLTGLFDYRFSIVIENSRQPGYFTEKIIDSMILGTVPIYWGCQEVNQIFDPRGILHFNNIEDLKNILDSNLLEYYQKNIDAILNNSIKARRFSSLDEVFVNQVWGTI